MENTGRIKKAVLPAVRRIVFERTLAEQLSEDLIHICRVDCAHLVMLAERKIVEPNAVAKLLTAIDRLVREDFAPLRGLPAPRGLFLLYEDYLIQTEGDDVGGILQTARSRNDLNATALRLRLRLPLLQLLREALRLQVVLLRSARRNVSVVMPLYTHGQAAEPTTFGHYLAAVAQAHSRDLRALFDVVEHARTCPLGACAATGTSFAIDTQRTATLLGFDMVSPSSLDAVASRDLVLRLLAAVVVEGLTLSRLATDFLLWTTREFAFLELPDELVGSSSAMPQKRNPFLLEHVQGRSGVLLGAFVASASAMHSTPFTNSIAVGTEAIRPVWQSLRDLTDITLISRLLVARCRANEQEMLTRAVKGHTAATALANWLVSEVRIPFRTAHRMVGEIVTRSIEEGGEFSEVARRVMEEKGIRAKVPDLDVVSVASAKHYGGGSSENSVTQAVESLEREWRTQVRRLKEIRESWRLAEDALGRAMTGVAELSKETMTR
jgi:argininosuccinate lyase